MQKPQTTNNGTLKIPGNIISLAATKPVSCQNSHFKNVALEIEIPSICSHFNRQTHQIFPHTSHKPTFSRHFRATIHRQIHSTSQTIQHAEFSSEDDIRQARAVLFHHLDLFSPTKHPSHRQHFQPPPPPSQRKILSRSRTFRFPRVFPRNKTCSSSK